MFLNLEQLRKNSKIYRKKDDEIFIRINILLEYSKLEMKFDGDINKKSKQLHITAFLKSMEISERTIQRWKKDYKERGPEGLGKLKVTGRPSVAIRPRILRVIEAYRKMFRWGSEVIQAHLKYDHQYKVSRHKIEKFLNESGLRAAYPCTTKKRQKAQKKKQHTKIVIVDHPGDHTMIDVKYQTHLLSCKEKCYVYNFIDHASNWSFKFPYSRYNAVNTVDFMEKVIIECPFEIKRLQSDNGVEFTYKYISVCLDEPKVHPLDTFCERNNIIHKLVPPGEKELQGLVERSHRQDDQELFSRINPHILSEFEKLLNDFVLERNQKRRFKKLSWLTPNEWLNKYLITTVAAVLLLRPLKNDVSHSSRKPAELVEQHEKEKLSILKNKEINTEDKCKNDVNIEKLAA